MIAQHSGQTAAMSGSTEPAGMALRLPETGEVAGSPHASAPAACVEVREESSDGTHKQRETGDRSALSSTVGQQTAMSGLRVLPVIEDNRINGGQMDGPKQVDNERALGETDVTEGLAARCAGQMTALSASTEPAGKASSLSETAEVAGSPHALAPNEVREESSECSRPEPECNVPRSAGVAETSSARVKVKDAKGKEKLTPQEEASLKTKAEREGLAAPVQGKILKLMGDAITARRGGGDGGMGNGVVTPPGDEEADVVRAGKGQMEVFASREMLEESWEEEAKEKGTDMGNETGDGSASSSNVGHQSGMSRLSVLPEKVIFILNLHLSRWWIESFIEDSGDFSDVQLAIESFKKYGCYELCILDLEALDFCVDFVANFVKHPDMTARRLVTDDTLPGMVLDALECNFTVQEAHMPFSNLEISDEKRVESLVARNRRWAELALGDMEEWHAGRVFLCGDGGAGKTTLKRVLAGHSPLAKVRRCLPRQLLPWRKPKRNPTRGWEEHRMKFSGEEGKESEALVMDLAGQEEYHLLHEFLMQESSSLQCNFFLVVVRSDPSIKGGEEVRKAAEGRLQYWLRFISSNSKPGVKRHVLVLVNKCGGEDTEYWKWIVNEMRTKFASRLTVEKEPLVMDLWKARRSDVDVLKERMKSICEMVTRDGRIPSLAKALLEQVQETRRLNLNSPMLTWEEFAGLPFFAGKEIRGPAQYLHDAGELLCFFFPDGQHSGEEQRSGVVILSPQWFGQKVAGELLLPRELWPKVCWQRGAFSGEGQLLHAVNFREALTPLLSSKVTADDLLEMMVQLRMCCWADGTTKQMLLVPALLPAHTDELVKQWLKQAGTGWVLGRRLAAGEEFEEEKRLTILPAGVFRQLQADLKQWYSGLGLDVYKVARGVIAFKKDGLSVLIWFDSAKQYQMDVLVKAVDPQRGRLSIYHLLEDIKDRVRALCRPLVGLKLVEYVLQPFQAPVVEDGEWWSGRKIAGIPQMLLNLAGPETTEVQVGQGLALNLDTLRARSGSELSDWDCPGSGTGLRPHLPVWALLSDRDLDPDCEWEESVQHMLTTGATHVAGSTNGGTSSWSSSEKRYKGLVRDHLEAAIGSSYAYQDEYIPLQTKMPTTWQAAVLVLNSLLSFIPFAGHALGSGVKGVAKAVADEDTRQAAEQLLRVAGSDGKALPAMVAKLLATSREYRLKGCSILSAENMAKEDLGAMMRCLKAAQITRRADDTTETVAARIVEATLDSLRGNQTLMAGVDWLMGDDQLKDWWQK